MVIVFVRASDKVIFQNLFAFTIQAPQ